MKAPNYIVGLFLATAIAVPSFVQHSEKRRIQTLESSLENQTSRATALSAKNRHLSEVAARFEQSESVTEAQTGELLQVRNDIASNRRSLQEMEAIRSRIARLREQLTDAASEAQFGPQIDTALAVDEFPYARHALNG